MEPLPATLTDRVAFRLQLVTAAVTAAGEAALAGLDLAGRQYGLLALLADRESASQHALGAVLGIDRTTTMKLLGDLERRGLVVRVRSATDRRSYAVALTEAGEAMRREAHALLVTCEDEFLAPLDVEERRVLYDLLRRLPPP